MNIKPLYLEDEKKNHILHNTVYIFNITIYI
jgi:hypothetical protein